MIGLVHKWITPEGGERYVPPLRLINRDDPKIVAWVEASINWGTLVLTHDGYVGYKYIPTDQYYVYSVSYYETMESLNALRTLPEYGAFLEARETYINDHYYGFEEAIIEVVDDKQIETYQDLENLLYQD